MKISISLLLIAISFFLGCGDTAFSQEKKSFFNGSLWIQGNELNPKSASKVNPNKEQELNKYFNFNPIVDFSKNEIFKKNNNLVKKQSSLFVVFRSTAEEENNLLKIERGPFSASLSTKKIVSDKEIFLNKGNSKTGATISYIFNKSSLTGKKDGKLLFDEMLYEDKEFKNQLLELIYVPRVLNTKEKNIVESYLAIKYGISLNEGQNYLNSKRDTIWNAKKNNSFNNRVTGIGKDAILGLNQKQSRNSLLDGLTIGINKIEKTNSDNKAVVADHTSLMWGDNGGQCLLEKESSGIEKRMKRIWKMETKSTTPENFNTQILVDKKLMVLENEQNRDTTDSMWLAIDSTQSSKFNYIHAKYISATINDDKKIIFDNIKFYANTNYLFTIVKAPEFFVTNDIEKPNCLIGKNGKLNIGMVGGTAPYKIQIVSNNYDEELFCNDEQMKIENLPTGSYSLEVIDKNNKTQKNNFVIDAFNENEISLNPIWYLADDSVKIIPKISADVTDFAWILEGNVLSTDKELEAKSFGNYLLKVGNKFGCKKEISFKVVDHLKHHNSGYIIFPDPVLANEDFTIQFDLKDASKVSIRITDMNGRTIKSKELSTIQLHQFNERLSISGTYLIVVTINGVVETSKLIVR